VGRRPLQIPSVIVIVRDAAGSVLLGRHSDIEQWVAPGGAIEIDESPTAAAVREVAEETGLVVEIIGILGAFGGGPAFRVTYANGDVVDYVMIVYDGRPVGGALAPSEELPELRYVPRAELLDLPLAPWARVVLPAVLDPPTGEVCS